MTSALTFLVPPAPPGLRPGPPPSFSVLIAAYNAAETIEESVESALSQTVAPQEIIVIDDGSTDGTAERVAPYRNRVVTLRQENRGAAAAVNVGASAATGDFVAILDADDVYEPGRVAALTALAQARPDLDILTTDAYVEVDAEVVGRFYETTPFEPDEQRIEIIERCFIAWPALRRSTLLRLGGYDESMRIAYDWECYLRLLYAGCRAGAVDEPLMRYRIGGNQSLSDNRIEALRDRVRVLERAEHLDLNPEERRMLDYYLGRRRRRVMLAESEQALREHRAGARRLSLAVATTAGMPAGTRVRAAAAALAPGIAGRRLAAIERRTGHSHMKRRPRA